MVVYLIGAIVCLKLWRHEATRRYRERHGHEVRAGPEVAFTAPPPANSSKRPKL